MDERVRQAQQWVNTTYRSVAGFVPVPESGQTGWPTMYALTRALQHELGIATLSDAFGPGTLAALNARGPIGIGQATGNIVKIIQSACYCKGYDPGGITGTFGLGTESAILNLTADVFGAGAGQRTVTPKLFKALLTMDAYVQVSGGTPAVRVVQQWLNSRYLNRASFFVIPCDGIFSRDVQKAMYLAVQYELGMSDADATGVFGPGTRSGLAGHELAEGATGIWVQLFSAALMFNRVALGDGSVWSTFTTYFTPALASAVRTLQQFSVLTVNGRADYATWCQVLVSTGDPGRRGEACDCVTEITDDRARTLYAAGYRYIGRYLDEDDLTVIDKMIRPGELATIFRNGLRVFPISQYYGREVGVFTYANGYSDARRAHTAAVGYGFATGTVIYFAVDYDATDAEIGSHIIPYFQGVVAGLASSGKRYVHGVYGSRNVCARVTAQTYARWSFVSGMSYGFSGNMGFPLPDNWAFNQVQTLTVGQDAGKIEIDKNIYRPGTDPAVAAVNVTATGLEQFLEYVTKLHQRAVAYGGDRPPNQLVLEFLRHEDYNDLPWRTLIGTVDGTFITYVKQLGIDMVREVRDPFFGIDLKVSHLGASCNGALVDGRPGGNDVNRGDVAGWGGDLMTFYGEWRRDSNQYPSGLAYCREKLAKVSDPTTGGTFKLRDLIEDADAFNLARRLGGTANIADVFTAYYRDGGTLTRFSRYYADRFNGQQNAKAIARTMLTTEADLVILAGRDYLIRSTAGPLTAMPGDLTDENLDAFVQGFAEMLLDRAGLG
ncbi:glycoside hydrolase domain-containing protein [Actinoplanes couchii]|uniref:Peptidoglycan-binding domain 1 protein n=1 Tax=Actinoplanes couchii TaxID=403638 RepID=A0ABQ3XF04_9ACTN|nr:glycoside hydrolase domain-containing protein [Actinoplanes couchii]MDR6319897.1 peptidoglycan hydrolase-like protein with peptidoglycan-binding domain [Actinoplanes couchii]GID57033.1 hypothetical protein Aco03nite_054370 [Actinoplanes couchii]